MRETKKNWMAAEKERCSRMKKFVAAACKFKCYTDKSRDFERELWFFLNFMHMRALLKKLFWFWLALDGATRVLRSDHHMRTKWLFNLSLLLLWESRNRVPKHFAILKFLTSRCPSDCSIKWAEQRHRQQWISFRESDRFFFSPSSINFPLKRWLFRIKKRVSSGSSTFLGSFETTQTKAKERERAGEM
jgi:hypothetical protein